MVIQLKFFLSIADSNIKTFYLRASIGFKSIF